MENPELVASKDSLKYEKCFLQLFFGPISLAYFIPIKLAWKRYQINPLA